MVDIEFLKVDINGGYLYYQHSKYPFHIDVEKEEGYITIIINKLFKGEVVKTLTKKCKVLGKMSVDQEKELVLDIVEIFLRK